MNRSTLPTLFISVLSALLLSTGCLVETEDDIDREAFVEDEEAEEAEAPAPGLEAPNVGLKAEDDATQDYYGCNQNSSCEDWCWCEFDHCESICGSEAEYVARCEQDRDNCLSVC